MLPVTLFSYVPRVLGAVTNCSDGGVIGMVPGIIGCLQVSSLHSSVLYIYRASVSDPYSLNRDPDPAKNLNPDPDPGKFLSPTKKFA